MASKSSQPQAFADGLQKLNSQISQLMTMPDADLQFCTLLQQAVVQQIRQGMGPSSAPGQPAPSSPPPAGANPGAMGMSATGGGPIDMSGGGNPAAAAGSPNMDEMSRALGSSSTVG